MNLTHTKTFQKPIQAAPKQSYTDPYGQCMEKATRSQGRISHMSIKHESRQINSRWCFKWEG